MPRQSNQFPVNQRFQSNGLKTPPQSHQQLLSSLPFRRVYYKSLQKGSLAYGQYLFWKYDPNPLVLVTDVLGDRIRGINLHYLTFKYVKALLSNYCGKPLFSYAFIKHDQYIVNAFRTYKKAGLRNLQLLDCDVINMQFQDRRKSYKHNPQELKFIKQQIRDQLRRSANPNAEQLANQYVQMLNTNGRSQDASVQQDGRRGFKASLAYPSQSATTPGQQTKPGSY